MRNMLTTQTPACSSIDAFIPVRYRLPSYGVSASSNVAVINYTNPADNTLEKDNIEESKKSDNNNYCNNVSDALNFDTSSVHYTNLFRLRARSFSNASLLTNNINLRWNGSKSKQDNDILTNKTIQTMRSYVISHKLPVPNALSRSEHLLNNYNSHFNGNDSNAMANTTAASALSVNMAGEVNKLTASSSTTLAASKLNAESNSLDIMNVSENIKNGLIATLTGAPPTEHNASDDADKQLMRIEEQVQLRLLGDKCDASKLYTFTSLSSLLHKIDKENESRSNDNTVSSVVDSNANNQTTLSNAETNERVLYTEAVVLLAKLIAMIKTSRTKASRGSVGCVNSIDLTSTKLGTIGDFYSYIQHEAALPAQQRENLSGNDGKLCDNSTVYSNTIRHNTNEYSRNVNVNYLPHHANADSLDFANHEHCKHRTELNLSSLSLEEQIAFPDIQLMLVWQSTLSPPQHTTLLTSESSLLLTPTKLNTSKNGSADTTNVASTANITAINKQKEKLSISKRSSHHGNNNSVIFERSLCIGMIAPLLFTPGDLRYRITELICANCALNDSDACTLSHILRLNKDKRQVTHLITLDLRNNNITNVGAEYLKKALKYNKTILTISLSGNDKITNNNILTSIEKRLQKNRSKHLRTVASSNTDGSNKNKKKSWFRRLLK